MSDFMNTLVKVNIQIQQVENLYAEGKLGDAITELNKAATMLFDARDYLIHEERRRNENRTVTGSYAWHVWMRMV